MSTRKANHQNGKSSISPTAINSASFLAGRISRNMEYK